jgi:hypothetical protein
MVVPNRGHTARRRPRPSKSGRARSGRGDQDNDQRNRGRDYANSTSQNRQPTREQPAVGPHRLSVVPRAGTHPPPPGRRRPSASHDEEAWRPTSAVGPHQGRVRLLARLHARPLAGPLHPLSLRAPVHSSARQTGARPQDRVWRGTTRSMGSSMPPVARFTGEGSPQHECAAAGALAAKPPIQLR